MAHVGTITGSMTLDPSAYMNALNQVAQHTARFQQSINAGSYGIGGMGASATRAATQLGSLNRSVYASMTAFYALSRTVTGALGVFEEYSNIVSRIANVADMSTNAILNLSEAMKGLNRDMGGSRTDLMKGVYRAVQSGFTTPKEFTPIATSAMALRTASGREINTTKAADAISVIRNSLGVKSGREGFVTDMLLRGRDVGRYELNEMTAALGIPLTIYGNQFSKKLGPEETLRQLTALLSSTTLSGLSPNRSATGLRRLVEKTVLLSQRPGTTGKNLHQGVRGLGYSSAMDAMDEGPMKYLETILRLSGGTPEGLGHLGFGSREMMVLASTLRGNMGQTRQIYDKLSPENIKGTTKKYIDQQKEEWWYKRDRLRSAYEDTQLNLMQAMLPTMESFAISLEAVNDLFQELGPTVKNLIGVMLIGSGARLLKNFYLRGGGGTGGTGGGNFAAQSLSSLTNVGFGKNAYSGHTPILPGPIPPGQKNPYTHINAATEAMPYPRSYNRQAPISHGLRGPYKLLPPGPTPYGLLPEGTSRYKRLPAGTSPFRSMPIRQNLYPLLPTESSQYDPWSSRPTQRRLLPAGTSPFRSMPAFAGGWVKPSDSSSRSPYKFRSEHLPFGSSQGAWLKPPQSSSTSKTLYDQSQGYNTNFKDVLSKGANAIRTGTDAVGHGLYTAGSAVGRGLYTADDAIGTGLYKAGSAIGSGFGAVGRGIKFLGSGPEARADQIQQRYDTRMKGAVGKYERGYAAAEKIRQSDIASGKGNVISKSINAARAGEKFESTIKNLRSEFDKSAQAASNSAMRMSKFSGVLSAIGSLANMAAIGGIFQLVSKFIEGFVGGNIITTTGGVEDISRSGTSYAGAWDPMDIFGRAAYGAKQAGYGIRGVLQGDYGDLALPGLKEHGGLLGYLSRNSPKRDTQGDISREQHKFYKERGMIWDEEAGSFKAASTQDAIDLAIRENFNPSEQTQIHRSGLGTGSKTNLKDFYDWMRKEKGIEGLDDPFFMTQKGVNKTDLSGYQYYGKEYAEYIKSTDIFGNLKSSIDPVIENFDFLAHSLSAVIEGLKGFGMLVMDRIRKDAAPNEWLASGKFLKQAKEAGAYDPQRDTVEGLQKEFGKQFFDSGILTDDFSKYRDAWDMQERKHPSLIAKKTYGEVEKPGKPSDWLKRHEGTNKYGLDKNNFAFARAEASGLDAEEYKKRRAVALFGENLFQLKDMGSGDVSSLLADMFGDEFTSGTDAFKENLIRQFKLTDVSKYADLVETGEHETNQVQKHSDALAFGTDAGYNAMLPYWAEQGDSKKKIQYLLERMETKIEAITKDMADTAAATAATAKKG